MIEQLLFIFFFCWVCDKILEFLASDIGSSILSFMWSFVVILIIEAAKWTIGGALVYFLLEDLDKLFK